MEKEIGLLTVFITSIFINFVKIKYFIQRIVNVLENMLSIFTNIKNGHNVDIPDVKPKDNNLKYDKLLKEHELLKEKLESSVKELASEKEKKKVQSSVKVEDTKNVDLQNGRENLFSLH